MSKFVAIISLGLVILLLLGGCATQEGGRYDWLRLDKEKKAPEKKLTANTAKEPERYDWLRPEEKKEVAKNPGGYDWLEARPEEEEKRAIGAEVGDIDLKLDYWMADGKQAWSIAVAGWKISELVFPADTDFLVLTEEYRFREKWSADISYGFGDTDKGTTTDSDWWPPSTDRWLLSHFDNTTGEASFWMVDLYYRFWTDNRSFLDAFWGFQHNKNSFRMRDGHWVIYDYLPDTTPIPGLDMRYEGEFQGIRLGFRGEMPLTSNPEWTLEGSVAYLPWVEAEGKGFWNLRVDPAPPYHVGMHIEQKGGEGDGIDAYVAINYRPHRYPNLTFELGYRFMELETTGGTSQNYWTEGTYVTPSEWQNNTCRFQGFFFGLSYRF